LWEFQTGAGMHAPASTFEHMGKQYLLAFAAGSAPLGPARGDSVWLFSLDGTLGPVQAGTPVSRNVPETSAPAPAVAAVTPRISEANLVEGKGIFTRNCAVCHGDDGKGGHTGGAPLDKMRDIQSAIAAVTNSSHNKRPVCAR